MSKHTPGPWSIGLRNGHNASQVYAGEEQDSVCQVYGIWSNRSVEECKDCEGIGNARLIAAAPELLDAAKEWLKFEAEEDDALLYSQVVSKMKAAISKAEGAL